ncbi:hypothetical protein FQZ97_968400 [compost metagenome]
MAQQATLIPYQRQGQEHQQHNHNGHQLIGWNTEQRGKLIDIGRQNIDAAWITEHQRYTKHLKADQQVKCCCEDQCRQDHRNRNIPADTPDGRAGNTRCLFQIGRQVAHGGRYIKIDMRNMGKPGNQYNATQRVDIPWYETEDVAYKDRHKSGWPDSDRVAKRQHQC